MRRSLSFYWISYSDLRVVYFFMRVWFSKSILWAIFLIHYNSDIICFSFSMNSWSFSFLLILSYLNFSFISFIFLWKNLLISAYCSIRIFEVLCWMVPMLSWISLWSSLICTIRFRSLLSIFVLDLFNDKKYFIYYCSYSMMFLYCIYRSTNLCLIIEIYYSNENILSLEDWSSDVRILHFYW